MIHSFDKEIAEKYGLLEAIILNHLEHWIEKNKANDMNYYDGNYWTYNSIKAYGEIFPYASPKQIQNALKKLIEEGIIITGNYNKYTYDRTLWYALTEKGKCIMQKRKMDFSQEENAFAKIDQPIPNNITHINNTDIKENNTKVLKEKKETFGVYGRIKLTADEYDRLVKDYGEEETKDMIALLDEYVESNDNKNKYTNYNLVIRKAIRENWFSGKKKKEEKPKDDTSYDLNEWYQKVLEKKLE